eukprot:gene11807-12882_t
MFSHILVPFVISFLLYGTSGFYTDSWNCFSRSPPFKTVGSLELIPRFRCGIRLVNSFNNEVPSETKIHDRTAIFKSLALLSPVPLVKGPKAFVQLNQTIEDAANICLREVDFRTDMYGSYRKFPLIISRLARGGKTTILQKLQHQLLKAGVLAVYITLNGGTNFELKTGESRSEAILRLIGEQLLIDPLLSSFEGAAVLDHINAEIEKLQKPFVLLIDELNHLGEPVEYEASRLLKSKFLDPMGRFLVFSSHVVLDLNVRQPGLGSYLTVESPRDYFTVSLPVSSSLKEIQDMDEICESITPAEMALYLGIPSLLYSLRVRQINAANRVNLIMNRVKQIPKKKLLSMFVDQLLDGTVHEEEPVLAKLQTLSTVEEVGKARFPLCFVGEILKRLSPTDSLVVYRIKTIIEEELPVFAQRHGGGVEWELVVELGILFNMLKSELKSTDHPLIHGVVIKESKVLTLRTDISNPEQAKEVMDAKMNSMAKGTLVFFRPSAVKFEKYDGFLAFKETTTGKAIYVSVQMKAGREIPKSHVEEWIDRFYLIRGKPARSNEDKGKLTNVGLNSLKALLGYSMHPLIPLISDSYYK